jgi:putative Holliday junction resolvase
MRIMAVDYGLRRVGIAVSDPQGTISQPLSTLKVMSRRQVIERLSSLIKDLEIGHVIVGYPCALDGAPTEMTKKIKQFVGQLKKKVDVGIELWDERLTSKYAQTTCKEMGIRRQKSRIDQVAACIMLDEYLSTKKRCRVS